jgi:hypothetical protein
MEYCKNCKSVMYIDKIRDLDCLTTPESFCVHFPCELKGHKCEFHSYLNLDDEFYPKLHDFKKIEIIVQDKSLKIYPEWVKGKCSLIYKCDKCEFEYCIKIK